MMNKTKVILKLFCLTTLGIKLLFIHSSAHAARWANVKVDKAIIYSDMQMTSTIGHIVKGKKVRVGEIPKNKGRLLPIIINKRVAYIKTNDLDISSDVKTLQTVTERVTQKMNRKTSRNAISLYTGPFFGKFSDAIFDTNNGISKTFFGFGAAGYHTNLESNATYKISFEAMQSQENGLKVTYYSLPINFMFHQILEKDYRLDFYAGFLLYPFIEFNFDDLLILNGQGVGGSVGVEYVRKIGNDFSAHFESTLDMSKLFNFGTATSTGMDTSDIDTITSNINGYMYGVKILGKISFEY